MNLIRRMVGAGCLMLALAVVSLACPSPDPGIMETPPCSSAQFMGDEPVVASQPETQDAPDAVDLTTVAANLLTALLIF